MTYFVTTKIFE